MTSIVAGKAILLTCMTTIFWGYTKILVIQRYYPHFDSWYWFSGFVWWTMVFRWELLQWIYCLLVAGNTLLLLLEVWAKLWQTLRRKQVNRTKLRMVGGGGETFPITSLIFGDMIFPFWCLAVGGHCPSHCSISSTCSHVTHTHTHTRRQLHVHVNKVIQ